MVFFSSSSFLEILVNMQIGREPKANQRESISGSTDGMVTLGEQPAHLPPDSVETLFGEA